MSLDKPYCHPNSSLQQMVVAALANDEATVWRVKGSHEDADSVSRRPVKKGDVVRLEHIATGKNLHSHGDRLAPLDKSQQEVTAWGEKGRGDNNDNWIFEPSEGDEWLLEQRFRLIHKNTNKALHSHLSSHPVFTAGFQEVTGFPIRDDNDFWVCRADSQPSPELQTRKHGSPLKGFRNIGWVDLLSIVGSLASITGWTIFGLRDRFHDASFVYVFSLVIASSLILGILLFLSLFVKSIYVRRTANPREPLWKWGFGLLVFAFAAVLFVVIWKILSLLAIHILVPILEWALK